MQLSRSWVVEKALRPIFTGGKAWASSDGKTMATTCTETVKILETETANVIVEIPGDGEVITTFAMRADCEQMVTCSHSFRIQQWELPSGKLLRAWLGHHNTPILDITYDVTGELIASGAADHLVRVWDANTGAATHNFKGHEGIVDVVVFHPDAQRLQLFSAGEDSHVRVWDLLSSSCIAKLSVHMSAVSSLSFSSCGEKLLSGGRDRVVVLWDLKTNTSIRTIPVFETLEAVQVLPDEAEIPNSSSEGLHFATAGENGLLRVWNEQGTCVWTQEAETGSATPYTGITMCPDSGQFVVVRADQNLIFYDADGLQKQRQLVGYNDEILDVKFTPDTEHIVLVSNSEQVRIFDATDFSCEALSGHTDIVLAVDISHDGSLIVSCGKDRQVRVWNVETKKCVAVCTGHNEAIGAVSFPKRTCDFVVSGSKDRTLKYWDLKPLFKAKTKTKGMLEPAVKFTEVAHEKDINCVAFAPNDVMLASSSQDKTVKLWSTSDMKLKGTLKGHKRGIWSVEFSPVDKCVASASADNMIKIWSVTDFSCLKTFEGHTASVLKVAFICAGMQLASVGGDGLLKVWTIKTAECVNTFDQHEDKIWAMGVKGDQIVTGGADSLLQVWKDVTQDEDEAATKDEEEKILTNQELDDAQRAGDYVKAAQLALKLNHSYRLRSLVEELISENHGSDEETHSALAGIVTELDLEEIAKLLSFVRDWNCHAKFTMTSQQMLRAVFMTFPPAKLKSIPGMREMLEALLPYSERHLQRVTGLLRGSYFIDYVTQGMALSDSGDALPLDAKPADEMEVEESEPEPAPVKAMRKASPADKTKRKRQKK